ALPDGALGRGCARAAAPEPEQPGPVHDHQRDHRNEHACEDVEPEVIARAHHGEPDPCRPEQPRCLEEAVPADREEDEPDEERVGVALYPDYVEPVVEGFRWIAVGDPARGLVHGQETEPDGKLAREVRPTPGQETMAGSYEDTHGTC